MILFRQLDIHFVTKYVLGDFWLLWFRPFVVFWLWVLAWKFVFLCLPCAAVDYFKWQTPLKANPILSQIHWEEIGDLIHYCSELKEQNVFGKTIQCCVSAFRMCTPIGPSTLPLGIYFIEILNKKTKINTHKNVY